MVNFIFTDAARYVADHDSFKGVVRPGVSNVGQLMDAVAEAMKFPKYFGENWNALSDCMRDFHWIDKKNVVLVHTDVPSIELDDLSIYIDVLKGAVDDWKDTKEHELFIVFPALSKEKILSVM
jgi:Barstar (barnase inhibitor)